MSQEFKPKFLSKEEREKLKAVKIQGCKTAIKAIRSRSPRDKAQTDEKGDPELEIIKSRFLGIKKTSHNMQKPSDKFRQVFKFE